MSLGLSRRVGIYFRKPGWIQDYSAAAKWSPVGDLADGKKMTIASFAGYLPMFRPMSEQYRSCTERRPWPDRKGPTHSSSGRFSGR